MKRAAISATSAFEGCIPAVFLGRTGGRGRQRPSPCRRADAAGARTAPRSPANRRAASRRCASRRRRVAQRAPASPPAMPRSPSCEARSRRRERLAPGGGDRELQPPCVAFRRRLAQITAGDEPAQDAAQVPGIEAETLRRGRWRRYSPARGRARRARALRRATTGCRRAAWRSVTDALRIETVEASDCIDTRIGAGVGRWPAPASLVSAQQSCDNVNQLIDIVNYIRDRETRRWSSRSISVARQPPQPRRARARRSSRRATLRHEARIRRDRRTTHAPQSFGTLA